MSTTSDFQPPLYPMSQSVLRGGLRWGEMVSSMGSAVFVVRVCSLTPPFHLSKVKGKGFNIITENKYVECKKRILCPVEFLTVCKPSNI